MKKIEARIEEIRVASGLTEEVIVEILLEFMRTDVFGTSIEDRRGIERVKEQIMERMREGSGTIKRKYAVIQTALHLLNELDRDHIGQAYDELTDEGRIIRGDDDFTLPKSS